MLLRGPAKSALGLKLATDAFREGWDFLRARDARRLKMNVNARGWRLVKGEGDWLRSGVGDTSKEAIAGALRLALGSAGDHFDAVEVVQIDLTRYPWFCLAKVRVSPWRIESRGASAQPTRSAPDQPACRQRRLPSGPQPFGVAAPMLKQMLIAANGEESRP